MQISGIYQIRNIVNNKVYIGSSQNINKRRKTHWRSLRKNKHHNQYLQASYNKYGENSFVFEVLEYIDNITELFVYEQKYIDKLQPAYNIGSVGGGDNISKHPNNLEFREKQSKIHKQRYSNMTPKQKKTISNNLKGDKNPNWRGGTSKKYCPNCNKEINVYAKACIKCIDKTGINNPFYGKRHTEETKTKLRNRNIVYNPPNKKKISIDGVIYESYTAAAIALEVSVALITYRVKNKYPNYHIVTSIDNPGCDS
jgi:group I intron endonuclease